VERSQRFSSSAGVFEMLALNSSLTAPHLFDHIKRLGCRAADWRPPGDRVLDWRASELLVPLV